MRTASYGAPASTPPAFTVDVSSTNYWEELAAYCYVMTLWNMSQAGFQIIEPQESDVTSLQSEVSGVLAQTISAIDSLYPNGQT